MDTIVATGDLSAFQLYLYTVTEVSGPVFDGLLVSRAHLVEQGGVRHTDSLVVPTLGNSCH